MYHVALGLNPDQVLQLKRAALTEGTTVKQLVTIVMLGWLERRAKRLGVSGKDRETEAIGQQKTKR